MALQHVFGATPVIKILDFLIDHQGHDYSKTEIARHAGISWTTISRHWCKLQAWDLVTPTRRVGPATMYKLNTENPIIPALTQFDEVTTTWATEEYREPAWSNGCADPARDLKPIFDESEHRWVVTGTSLTPAKIQVTCDRCGMDGTISNYTVAEWGAAYSPNGQVWADNERVKEVIE